MGLKEKYAQRKINKFARKHIHHPVFPSLANTKMVGVVWQPSQKEAFQYLNEYYKKEKVIFRGFCVFEETANPHPDINSLTTNDLNWLGFPKPLKVNDFLSIKFDVLFNIAFTQNLVLDYITILSNARFKVGTSVSDSNYFDLNIKIGEKEDTLYLVKQQIFYLAQLNKTTSK